MTVNNTINHVIPAGSRLKSIKEMLSPQMAYSTDYTTFNITRWATCYTCHDQSNFPHFLPHLSCIYLEFGNMACYFQSIFMLKWNPCKRCAHVYFELFFYVQ